MREILFRGKSVDSGEWIYGSLVYCPMDDEQASIVVFEKEDEAGFIFGNHNDVYLKTVGQFTGLVDKNGVKIFEGDVLKREFTFTNRIAYIDIDYEDCSFIYHEGKWSSPIDDGVYGICLSDYEIVGNLHDNPELLEEES